MIARARSRWFGLPDELRVVEAGGGGPRRTSTLVHATSLAALTVFLLIEARGQWFFYDEWDVLSDDHQWDLLAPHNGHLSLLLALAFTLLKLVFGLHSYWPYVALSIGAHLVLVHVLWRFLRRMGVHPLIVLCAPVIFGVLAPGSSNVMWAFQFAFILPVAIGLGALLLVDGPNLSLRRSVGVAILLFVGLCCSSTSLPMTAAVILFVLVRHGWRSALSIAAMPGTLYLAWRLAFARGTENGGLAVRSLGALAGPVQDFMVSALVDGLAKTGPFGAVSGALVVISVALIVWRACRWPVRELPAAYFSVVALLVFIGLTAMSRVQLGAAGAAADRYVYVEAALAIPVAALGVSRLARFGRGGWTASVVLLASLVAYNVAGFATQARQQAALNQLTRADVLAAADLGTDRRFPSEAVPAPVLAPTLTMREIDQFRRDGRLPAAASNADARLSVETALELSANHLDSGARCDSARTTVDFPAKGPRRYVVLDAGSPQSVTVVARRGTAVTSYVTLELKPGRQLLEGMTSAVITLSASSAILCSP